MNPDLLSSTASSALVAAVAMLLLAHLCQLAGRHWLRHSVDALTCAGLLYLFGMRAFGWAFAPREALCSLFLLVAIGVAVAGWRREATGFSWRLTAAQAAAMAYVFAPFSAWRPAASLLLFFFFLFETVRWLAGTEEPLSDAQRASPHPPLFAPKRRRGPREFALAGTAAILAYVFATGTLRAPPPPPPPETAAPAAEAVVEPPASPETTAEEATTPASEPATPVSAPAAPVTYTTAAGDTFKSIARKLYGKPEKWRALAAANPGLKPGAKFKAGVSINLPEPPAH